MKTLLLSVLVYASLLPVARAGVTVHQLDENVSFQAVTWQDNYAVASGTSGGIYLSGDDGASWQQIPVPTGSESWQFRDNQRLGNGLLSAMIRPFSSRVIRQSPTLLLSGSHSVSPR